MLIELTGVEATVEQISSAMQPILHELFRTVRIPTRFSLLTAAGPAAARSDPSRSAPAPPRNSHSGAQTQPRPTDRPQIATGSRADNLEIKSSGLRELFDCFPSDRIVTADTLAELNLKGKPDPAIFELAARRLGRTTADARSRTLVFEDGVPGVQAALAVRVWRDRAP